MTLSELYGNIQHWHIVEKISSNKIGKILGYSRRKLYCLIADASKLLVEKLEKLQPHYAGRKSEK